MNARLFGTNKQGEPCTLYRLSLEKGIVAEVTDFGATLVSLSVPDRDGKYRDVVLGYDSPAGYEGESRTFFGAVIGRNANRIGGGAFVLNGTEYQLEKNNGENNLHSGTDSYAFRKWDVKQVTDRAITFSLYSPDGDQGFPGAVTVEVTYAVTEENMLRITYGAKAEKDTVINLTNHSYFNLDGHASGSVLEQTVWIDGDCYTETDAGSIPTGVLCPVAGTPMDFRRKKRIGAEIGADYVPLIQARGYDHNWVLNNGGKFSKVASLSSQTCGITMEVFTDLPGMQIYTGNYLEHEVGKRGAVYEKHQGVCFETQYYPDAVNHPSFPSPVCRGGEEYRTETAFRFLCCEG